MVRKKEKNKAALWMVRILLCHWARDTPRDWVIEGYGVCNRVRFRRMFVYGYYQPEASLDHPKDQSAGLDQISYTWILNATLTIALHPSRRTAMLLNIYQRIIRSCALLLVSCIGANTLYSKTPNIGKRLHFTDEDLLVVRAFSSASQSTLGRYLENVSMDGS